MTVTGPRGNAGKESLTDVTRRLLWAAYPDKDAAWIDEQVTLAGRRVAAVDPRPAPHPPPALPRISPRGRHMVALAIGVVLLAATLFVGITQREWFAEAAIGGVGVVLLIAGIVVTLTATIVDRVRARRRKVLSCRVRIDARFDADSIDAGEIITLRRPDRTAIRNPGVVVARIKNMGRTPIEPADYLTPLRIGFPGREVVTVDVTESDPPELANSIPRDPEFSVVSDRILLPKIPLAAGDSFKLVILLSGTEAGTRYPVGIDGSVRNGGVTTKPSFRRFRRNTIIGGGLTALLAGALAVVLLLNNVRPFTRLPAGLVCVRGQVTISGSSAFGLAATKSAGSYHAYCHDSVVDVLTPGSLAGLSQLAAIRPADRPKWLALSDGMADPGQFPGLVPHALGVVPYTMVVNAKAPLTAGLTLAQARAIFTGAATHWSDITGNPKDTEEIRVIARTPTSGTRRTLERYLLGAPEAPATSDSCLERRPNIPTGAVVCEQGSTGDLVGKVASVPDSIGYADVPDVNQTSGVRPVSLDGRGSSLADIRAGYPFWTIEYLYSHGPLLPGTLSSAFADYLGSPESSSAMASFQYYACHTGATDLCASNR